MGRDKILPANPLAYLKPRNLLRLYTAVGSLSGTRDSRTPWPASTPPSARVEPKAAASIVAPAPPAGGHARLMEGLVSPHQRHDGPRRALGAPADHHLGAPKEPDLRRPAPVEPGVLPVGSLNGPGLAWQVPGLGERKALLQQACLAHGITDRRQQVQILAAALIEGELDQNTDSDKTGLSTTHGVFNLNSGMIDDLGLHLLTPRVHDVDDLAASLHASVAVIQAAINAYGLEGFMLWQRGGQTLKDDPEGQSSRFLWPSYAAAFDNTVRYLSSGSGLVDDFRYAEVVKAV